MFSFYTESNIFIACTYLFFLNKFSPFLCTQWRRSSSQYYYWKFQYYINGIRLLWHTINEGKNTELVLNMNDDVLFFFSLTTVYWARKSWRRKIMTLKKSWLKKTKWKWNKPKHFMQSNHNILFLTSTHLASVNNRMIIFKMKYCYNHFLVVTIFQSSSF